MRSRRTTALICAALTTVTVGACSAAPENRDSRSPGVPEPPLADVVLADYTVLDQEEVALVPDSDQPAVVVTSSGPGTPGVPVSGGTSNVQVLTYDPATKRWNIAFDAADTVPSRSGEPATPVLDQTATLEEVTAEPVWFEGQPAPDLLVYATDHSANHQVGQVAVVRFRPGSAEVLWRSSLQGMDVPEVTGAGQNQQVSIEADYFTGVSAACCPVRRFAQTVGAVQGEGVGVVADDRTYLGAWLAESGDDPDVAVVLAVEPHSPAADVLRAGDRLVGVGTGEASPAEGLGPAQVEGLGRYRPGEKVSLRVLRGTAMLVREAVLGSVADVAEPAVTGHGVLGVDVDPSLMEITRVPSGPAWNAGLAAGDRLVSIGGRGLSTIDDLRVALWGTAGIPTEVVFLDYEGQQRTTTVTPGYPPEDSALPVPHRV